jgi:hypothetical protein
MSTVTPTYRSSRPRARPEAAGGRSASEQRGIAAAFGHVRALVGAYLTLSVACVGAIALLRNDHAAVNSAVWSRATIVVVSALVTFSVATRAARGSARALLRLRIVTGVMVAAIAVIITLPGTFPLWMKLEQAACGMLLLAVIVIVNRRPLRGPSAGAR